MAYQVGATCYRSAEQALSAIASGELGQVVQHGGTAYVVGVDTVTADAIKYRLTPVAGGQAIGRTIQLTPQPCGLLDWQDGLTLGWGVAAAWIVTAAVMHLRKAAHQ